MTDALKGARTRLHKRPNVNAVWTGRDGKVRVGVERKVSRNRLSPEDIVPAEVEGRETEVVTFRRVRPLIVPRDTPEGDSRELTRKRRPCPGGFSIGHYAITAGTLGCWVLGREGEWVILSNNHVLANSNEGVEGDRITQPGPHDLDGVTTDPGNWIGQLKEFATINHEGGSLPGGCQLPGIGKFFSKAKPKGAVEQPYPNLVDAGTASWFGGEGNAVDPAIHDIGVPSRMRPPNVGEPVEKTGRTTEHQVDTEIEALDLSVQVDYGSFTAMFELQGMVISEAGTPFSQPGDSGSGIVAQGDKALVGLLYAGGQLDDGRDATIFNNIVHVQEILGVSL